MKYCDLHCDSLTATVPTVSAERLKESDCLLQCLAIFTKGRELPVLSSLEKLKSWQEKGAKKVVRSDEIGQGVNVLLTTEGDVFRGDLGRVELLYALGVRMSGLCWNTPSTLVYCASPVSTQKGKGLKPFGRRVVEKMKELGMIVDVSHADEEAVSEVADFGVPFVASHSDPYSVCLHPRNLSDDSIRKIARSGGVVGLTFCPVFLASVNERETQKKALLSSVGHLIKVGGEDVLAVGSDFDGAPKNAYVSSPERVQELLWEVEKRWGSRVAEKMAFGNFLRVFKEVCG